VAEEVHRPLGGDEGLRSAWLAVRIADGLLDRHRPRESEPREPGRQKLPASVLTDLLALAWARFANALRIVGEIPSANDAMRNARTVADAFELNPWVEAEIASLHASLLKDEGLDLELAEKKADEAVALFRTFDAHLAARTLVVKAGWPSKQEVASVPWRPRQRNWTSRLDPFQDPPARSIPGHPTVRGSAATARVDSWSFPPFHDPVRGAHVGWDLGVLGDVQGLGSS
jgi:hypothetical protein